jgi:hypothetical protein
VTGRLTRRAFTWFRVLLALVVAGSFIGAAPVRAADDEPAAETTLAGYQGSAAASGLHAFYNPAGLLPLPPPVDLGAPDALATIASGPATFARAGVADPGDLLANPDAVLALLSAQYPAGTVPPFPLRIQASSGVGEPVVESNPAPGLNARVTADGSGSTANASMPGSDLPAIARVGSLTASATTTTDGSSVTVHARSQAGGINVLNLITIDAVVTDVTATSDGSDTKLTGGTTVTGASVLGQKVTIDADGVHAAADQPPLLGGILTPLVGSLNDLLKGVGLNVTLAGPVASDGSTNGQLGSAGLRIALDFSPDTIPVLRTLIDSLPPIENPLPGVPSIEDVLAAAQARNLAAIEIGRGVVSLSARSVGGDTGGAIPDFTDTSGGGFPSTSGDFSLPGDGGTVPGGTGGSQPVGTTEEAELPVGAGVGGLVLLILLLQPFLGERIAWISSAVLAADRSDTCTWEER